MISVQNLRKVFSPNIVAVDDISFSLKEGETLCLIGTSGCGKTTTLKMLNRILEPSSGEIHLLGKNILEQDRIEVRRRIGYVIQRGGLFPHWTVAQNISLVPRLLKWSPEKIKSRVEEMLNLVDLSPVEYIDRYPAQLSGGQQQRIGIARALAADPPVVLFDEPFSALDPITRKQIQEEFLALKKKVHKTSVFVTHDVREAFLLGDKILLMKQGKMEQYGTPEELQNSPANEFVRNFIQNH